jgi:hypothetical protein
MYFADLTPCEYNIPEPRGLSVGWLDKAHEFSRGSVPVGFAERLRALCKTPAVRHRGFHVCEFCGFEYDPTFKQHREAGALSASVIRVIGGGGQVYYSPVMICHYITKHGYKPPEDFIRAVMRIELSMRPNAALDPTPITPVSPLSRLARFFRRGSAFDR